MDFFEVVTTQRAIRRLKPEPIPDAVLRQIMDAAICAPSGGNRQGWSFLIIRDAAKRARLGELYRGAWGELMNRTNPADDQSTYAAESWVSQNRRSDHRFPSKGSRPDR
jgi:nitroreductase